MIGPRERANFFAFCAAIVIISTAKAMLMPLVPLYAVHLGASPAIVGLLVSAAFWLPLFLAMLVGAHIDQVGYTELLLWGTLALGVSPIVVALTANLYYLAAAQVLVGLAQLVIVLSSQAFVASLGGGRQRMRFYGWYSSFQSGGQLVGPVLVGLVIDLYGYSASFMLAGIIPFLAFVVLMYVIRYSPITIVKPTPRKPRLTPKQYPIEALGLLQNVGVQMAMITSCSVIFAMTLQATLLPVYLESLAFPATLIGALFSLRAFASMVIRPLMPWVIGIHGNRSRTLLSMTLIIAISIGATGFLGSFGTLAALFILTGLASGISQPLSLVAVADHTEDERRGFAIGLRLTGNRLAQVTSPIIFGLFVAKLGFQMTFLIGSTSLVLAAIYIWLLMPAFERAERIMAGT